MQGPGWWLSGWGPAPEGLTYRGTYLCCRFNPTPVRVLGGGNRSMFLPHLLSFPLFHSKNRWKNIWVRIKKKDAWPRLRARKPVRKQPPSSNGYTMGTQYLLILASIFYSSLLTPLPWLFPSFLFSLPPLFRVWFLVSFGSSSWWFLVDLSRKELYVQNVYLYWCVYVII